MRITTLVVLWFGALTCRIQPQPNLLPPTFIDTVLNELSGEKAWKNVSEISKYYREDATPGFHEAVDFLISRLGSYGFDPNQISVERFKSDGKVKYYNKRTRYGWQPGRAELWLEKPLRMKLADFEAVSTSLATWSTSTNITTELVYVGPGKTEDDFKVGDLKGKIVLTSSMPNAIQHEAVAKRGAAGIVSFWSSPARLQYPDLVNWLDTANNHEEVKSFAFVLSRRMGLFLKEMLEVGKKLTVRALVDADLVSGELEVLSTTIPGAKYPQQEVVYVAHLCHFSPSSNDNASGCAVILEIARTLHNLIDQKIINPPLRAVRFMWVPENYGTVAYLSAHPEFSNKAIAAINLDMVGEDLEKTNAIFRLFRTPASRPSYLNSVVEHFVELCDKLQITSSTGSRAPFNYRFMPFALGSDHYWLNDAAINIPTVMLSHWPDLYYHSSHDTPDKCDPTELKRAAFIALCSLWYVANVTPDKIMSLSSEVEGRTSSQIAETLREAAQLLALSDGKDLNRVWKRAINRLHLAQKRRRKALASIDIFARDDLSSKYISSMLERIKLLEELERQALNSNFRAACQLKGIKTKKPQLTDDEKRLRKIIPRRKRKFLSALWNKYIDEGLVSEEDKHWIKNFKIRIGDVGSCTYEILNFVNGTRNLLEIRNSVEAERFSDHMFLDYFGPAFVGFPPDYIPQPSRHIEANDLEHFMKLLETVGLIELNVGRITNQ
ncbi:MAG: DUF4910 domain-containing protein [bacterium]